MYETYLMTCQKSEKDNWNIHILNWLIIILEQWIDPQDSGQADLVFMSKECGIQTIVTFQGGILGAKDIHSCYILFVILC